MKDGSNTKEGYIYHDLPGSGFKSHRGGSQDRADFIAQRINVNGKVILDLGCSVGGISYCLGKKGANVEGVDYDKDAIEIGNKFIQENKWRIPGEVGLWEYNITPDFFPKLDKIKLELARVEAGNWDIVLWLSQWMWFVKQYGIEEGLNALYEVSKKCNILIFDSAAEDGRAGIKGMTQDRLEEILIQNTCFTKIERFKSVTPEWHDRDLFICSKPVQEWRRHRGAKVMRIGREWVNKINEKKDELSLEMKNDIIWLQKLQPYINVPRLGKVFNSCYYMSYEGSPITKLTDADIRKILQMLQTEGIVHRDIIPSNLLWNGEEVILIDWSWAVPKGEENKDFPENLGEKYKSPHGFDDEYSLRKIQEELNGR